MITNKLVPAPAIIFASSEMPCACIASRTVSSPAVKNRSSRRASTTLRAGAARLRSVGALPGSFQGPARAISTCREIIGALVEVSYFHPPRIPATLRPTLGCGFAPTVTAIKSDSCQQRRPVRDSALRARISSASAKKSNPVLFLQTSPASWRARLRAPRHYQVMVPSNHGRSRGPRCRACTRSSATVSYGAGTYGMSDRLSIRASMFKPGRNRNIRNCCRNKPLAVLEPISIPSNSPSMAKRPS